MDTLISGNILKQHCLRAPLFGSLKNIDKQIYQEVI